MPFVVCTMRSADSWPQHRGSRPAGHQQCGSRRHDPAGVGVEFLRLWRGGSRSRVPAPAHHVHRGRSRIPHAPGNHHATQGRHLCVLCIMTVAEYLLHAHGRGIHASHELRATGMDPSTFRSPACHGIDARSEESALQTVDSFDEIRGVSREEMAE